MKVFFSGIDDGDYISSLISGLKKKHINVINGHDLFIQKKIPKGAIIHIHWPESYFSNWLVDSNSSLRRYLSAIQYYKDQNPIVFTVHNLLPHDGKSDLMLKLYEATVQSATIIHHLGPKGIDVFNNKYPSSKNIEFQVIPHHILPTPARIPLKSEAKRQLSIDKDVELIFCPGSLRYTNDIRQLWVLYENVKTQKNTKLVVHKYRNLLNRFFLYNIFQYPTLSFKEFKYRLLSKNVTFINQSLSLERLCIYFAASDLVLLPRTHNLNSGMPFLTVHFNVPLLVQAKGNITWSLEKLEYRKTNEVFVPNDINVEVFNEKIMKEMKSLYEKMV